MSGRAIRFGTLGTEGSNHAMVVRRYIAFRGIANAEVVLYREFGDAFRDLVEGDIEYVLQVSVHPDHTAMSARYLHRAHVVDTFIASSKELAVVTRRGLGRPSTIAFQPATREYVDLGRWTTHVPEISIMTVAEGLLEGRYDSGITAVEIAERHPDRLQVDELIGSVADVWVLFGREPLGKGPLAIWPDAPVVEQLRERQAAGPEGSAAGAAERQPPA